MHSYYMNIYIRRIMMCIPWNIKVTSRKRDCLLKSLFGTTMKKYSDVCTTDLLWGEYTGDPQIPTQRVSNAKHFSMHGMMYTRGLVTLLLLYDYVLFQRGGGGGGGALCDWLTIFAHGCFNMWIFVGVSRWRHQVETFFPRSPVNSPHKG